IDVEPVTGIGVMAAQQYGRAVFAGEGYDARFASRSGQCVAHCRADQVFRRTGLFVGRTRRYRPILLARADTVRLPARVAIVPAIAYDAVAAGQATRCDGRMSGACLGTGVGVVTIGKPGSVVLKPAKAIVSPERFPAVQVIGAHLVEDNE